MDNFCKQIIYENTQSNDVILMMEHCKIVEYDDIVEVDDEILDRIQDFIFLQGKNLCALELSDKRILFNDKYMVLSPGLRVKLLRAVEQLRDCRPPNEEQTSTQRLCDVEPNKAIGECKKESTELSPRFPAIKNEHVCTNVKNMEFLSSVLTRERKQEIISLWVDNLIERVNKKYPQSQLVYQRDFELDIQPVSGTPSVASSNDPQDPAPDSTQTPYCAGDPSQPQQQPRYGGWFYCRLCLHNRGSVRRIRFSISKDNYVILSNVMTHLKQHFRPVTPSLTAPSSNIGNNHMSQVQTLSPFLAQGHNSNSDF